MGIELSGVDLSDPTPGQKRELATNRGSSGGFVASRDILILCNKLSSVGSGSVDGLGDTLNTPIRIGGGEQEVIDRCGYKSEALLLFKTAVKHNSEAVYWLDIVPPGTGSASVDFTFATNSAAVGAVNIDFIGEREQVGIISGDTPTIVAGLVKDKINAMLHWPLTASNVAGVLTVTASAAGSRFDHYLNKIRISMAKPSAMTISKGSVTAGSTDDDQTTAISTLGTYSIYYQVNPKQVTSAPTSTDNGIGEHLATMTDWVSPAGGKSCELIVGNVGTPTQAGTVAAAMNLPYAKLFHAENNDYSAGMLAVTFAAIRQKKEASNRAANLANYGRKSASDTLYVPDPYAKTDRPTGTEIKTMLNTGVTPCAFDDTGKPYIVWHVSTKSLTNSVVDYRGRPGHQWSVLCDFWESLRSLYNSEAQDNVADDPVNGAPRLVNFTYPSDVKAMAKRTIDQKIDGAVTTLDPSQRDAMKASVVVERLTSGTACRADIAVVRHNLKGHFLINEVSPAI